MGYYPSYYNLTLSTLFVEAVNSFSWILILPWVLYGIERRSRRRSRSRIRGEWQALPFLAWAVTATWRHIDFWSTLAMSLGPPMEMFFIVPCVNFFSLGALCTSHALISTVAGEPGWSLGSALRRGVVRVAVVLSIADGLFMALAIRSYLPDGVWSPLGGIPLHL